MVAKQHSSTVIVPHDVLDNAALSLRQARQWIATRELQPSAVTRALIEFLHRTATHVEAALRMAEADAREHQPATADELGVWTTIEEVIALGVRQALGFADDDPRTLASVYCLQRRAWQSLPRGWARWSTSEAEAWALALLAAAEGASPHPRKGAAS